MSDKQQQQQQQQQQGPRQQLEDSIFSLIRLYQNINIQEGYAGLQHIDEELETRRQNVGTLLLQHPELSSIHLEYREDNVGGFRGPPLRFLIYCGCRLDAVRAVVEACEARGLLFGGYNKEIISDACDYAIHEDIIHYLVKRAPSEPGQEYDSESSISTLCSALARPWSVNPAVSDHFISMDTIQILMDYELKRWIEKDWIDEALRIACSNGNEDIIRHMLDARDSDRIDSFGIACPLGTQQFARNLSIILPSIRGTLVVRPDRWTVECMEDLCNSLCAETTMIDRIHLDMISSDIVRSNQIQRLMESNPVTTEFGFDFDGGNSMNICQGVYQGVNGNNTLQRLHLFNVQFDGSTLCNLLRNNGSTLRALRLLNCEFTGTFQLERSHAILGSQLDELRVIHGRWESATYLVTVLKQIGLIPSIRRLHMARSRLQPNFDITEGVVAILNQGTLHSLDYHGYTVDTDSIHFSKALAENTSLKKLFCFSYETVPTPRIISRILKVVESHNTTLEFVLQNTGGAGGVRTEYEKLRYLLHLNRFGRGKARDPSLPLSAFVDLLSNEELEVATSCVDGKSTPFKHNILFGLLRECPSIWCMKDSTVKNRKTQCNPRVTGVGGGWDAS